MIETAENSSTIFRTSKFLFPSLTEASSNALMQNDEEKRPQHMSCPSIDSFIIIEQQKKTKVDDTSPTATTTTTAIPNKKNYDDIKDILLSISTKNCQMHQQQQQPQKIKTDTLDEWCIYALTRQKLNRRYLKNKYGGVNAVTVELTPTKTPTILSPTTTTTTTATSKTVTPLEIVSNQLSNGNSPSRLSNHTPSFNKTEKYGLPQLPLQQQQKPITTITSDADQSYQHFSDWRLHLLNYKQNKGQYLTPKDIKRLLNIQTYSSLNKPADATSTSTTNANADANTKNFNNYKINKYVTNNTTVISNASYHYASISNNGLNIYQIDSKAIPSKYSINGAKTVFPKKSIIENEDYETSNQQADKNIIEYLDRILPVIKSNEKKHNHQHTSLKYTKSKISETMLLNKTLGLNNSTKKITTTGNNKIDISNTKSSILRNESAAGMHERIKRVSFMINNDDQSKMVEKFKLTKFTNFNGDNKKSSHLPSTPIVIPINRERPAVPAGNMHSIKFLRNDKSRLSTVYQRFNEATNE